MMRHFSYLLTYDSSNELPVHVFYIKKNRQHDVIIYLKSEGNKIFFFKTFLIIFQLKTESYQIKSIYILDQSTE